MHPKLLPRLDRSNMSKLTPSLCNLSYFLHFGTNKMSNMMAQTQACAMISRSFRAVSRNIS